MTAIIWCNGEEVLTFSCANQPLPRVGEHIHVERDVRRIYVVESVLWSYRFIPVSDSYPMADHRVEIHVRGDV